MGTLSPQMIGVQALTGLAHAMFLFLIAAGLSLIFGVTRILNFSHGSFFMLAAYITYSVTRVLEPWGVGFWLALFFAPLSIAALGWVIERFLLRRIYGAPEILQLLLTFGLVLIFADLVLAVWGSGNKSVPIPASLSGSFRVFGQPFPIYYLLVLTVGPIATLALWALSYRTKWGILIRAATEDRQMLAALGMDQHRLFSLVFVVGSWLAGLSGVLAAPLIALSPGMDMAVIVEAFVVVVVGGMGSFAGSLFASILIGLLKSMGILIIPGISIVLIFAFMAVVLVLRPWGLLGERVEETKSLPPLWQVVPRKTHPALPYAVGALLALILFALPIWAPTFWVIIASEVLAFGLFATSLNLLMGYGGMISFGHAAYLGLGAYGAALLLLKARMPFAAAFALSPFLAAFFGLVFGFFCVRLSQIYFAMLTLAFAQILYTVAFQWYDFTGGDNGLLGVWPAGPLSTPASYYYFSLLVCTLGVGSLWLIARSPFGAALEAARDNPTRAESVGIPVRLIQHLAFVISAFFAGLSGALFVFQKGSVFPDYLSVLKSIEALIMILLGGMNAFLGPLIGAGTFKFLDTLITAGTQYWQAVLGTILTGLVLLFPRGITGYALGRSEGTP